MTDEGLAPEPAIAETLTDATNGEADAKPIEAKEPAPAPGDAKPVESESDKLQKRFDKLTREKYDAQRRADQLEYRLQMLESAKQILNIPFDSKALKFCARVGLNVLLTMFGRDGMAYLLSQERRKLEEP